MSSTSARPSRFALTGWHQPGVDVLLAAHVTHPKRRRTARLRPSHRHLAASESYLDHIKIVPISLRDNALAPRAGIQYTYIRARLAV